MFLLRACLRGCNGRSLPCLRVSVVAALPSSPLPTAGLARCGGCAGCLPVGRAEGRGTSPLSPRGKGEPPTRERALAGLGEYCGRKCSFFSRSPKICCQPQSWIHRDYPPRALHNVRLKPKTHNVF